MTPSPACRTHGCRSQLGYATDMALPPPPRSPRLPTVQVFESERASGFVHLRKHAVVAMTGADVLELLKLAWPSELHTVVRERRDVRIWMLDSDGLANYFASRKLHVVSWTCAGRAAGWHCCTPCALARPAEHVARSVRTWFWTSGDRRPEWTTLADHELSAYLTGQPDYRSGTRYDIVPDLPIRRCWLADGCRKDYSVPIVLNGDVANVRVRANAAQHERLQRDEQGFARTHAVEFAEADRSGLRANFVER